VKKKTAATPLFQLEPAFISLFQGSSLYFGIIIIALSMFMFSNTEQLVQFIGGSFTYFLLTFEFAAPLVILIISWLRGVEEKEGVS